MFGEQLLSLITDEKQKIKPPTNFTSSLAPRFGIQKLSKQNKTHNNNEKPNIKIPPKPSKIQLENLIFCQMLVSLPLRHKGNTNATFCVFCSTLQISSWFILLVDGLFEARSAFLRFIFYFGFIHKKSA